MMTDRDVEKEYSLQDFIAELRRLADTLEAGDEYVIEIDEEKILVPSHAIFSIEHEREDGEHEIEFQITWSDADGDDDEDEEDEEDETDDADEDEEEAA